MRNLVTIRTVKEIREISEADNIETAVVDGWQCVVKKGEFAVGDQGLYFEIDSLLPKEDPRFSFMEKSNFRVKTIKLRGQISQGLLLPLEQFPEVNPCLQDRLDDVSLEESLGVTKYEPPLPGGTSGNMRGNFPSFIPKTNQERIQNIPEVLEGTIWDDYWITEKLDGTSCTIYHKDGHVGVCSRNFEMKHDDSSIYSKILTQCEGLEERLKELGNNLAIQGEIIGPGIRKNLYKLDKHQLRVFHIWDIDNQCSASWDYAQKLIFRFGLNCVPNVVFEIIHPDEHEPRLESVLRNAEAYSQINLDHLVEREGLVFTHKTKGFSFKVISNKWLLKNQ